MIKERQPHTKALQSEIFFAMHEKIKMGVTLFINIFMFVLYIFTFCLSKLGFEKCVLIIYFLYEEVKFGEYMFLSGVRSSPTPHPSLTSYLGRAGLRVGSILYGLLRPSFSTFLLISM
jgi:hypothetical protein